MNPGIKASWLEALRSGRYQQGQGQLRSDRSWCCLGVLCDVVDPDLWIQCGPSFSYLTQIDTSFPPEAVTTEADLPRLVMLALSRMNDSIKVSFVEIADWIEGNL